MATYNGEPWGRYEDWHRLGDDVMEQQGVYQGGPLPRPEKLENEGTNVGIWARIDAARKMAMEAGMSFEEVRQADPFELARRFDRRDAA